MTRRLEAAVSVMALTLVISLVTGGKTPAAAAKSNPQEFTNDALDREHSTIDGKLTARVAKIDQNAEKQQAAQSKMKQDRLNYERQMANEQKSFYVYMKSMKLDERETALKQFMEKQEKNRQKFDKDQLSAQKQWFKDNIEARSESADITSETSPDTASSKAGLSGAPPVMDTTKGMAKPAASGTNP